jgi:hypothetical protein
MKKHAEIKNDFLFFSLNEFKYGMGECNLGKSFK